MMKKFGSKQIVIISTFVILLSTILLFILIRTNLNTANNISNQEPNVSIGNNDAETAPNTDWTVTVETNQKLHLTTWFDQNEGSPCSVPEFALNQPNTKFLINQANDYKYVLTLNLGDTTIFGKRILPLKLTDDSGEIKKTFVVNFNVDLPAGVTEYPNNSVRYLNSASTKKFGNIYFYPFSGYDNGESTLWNTNDLKLFVPDTGAVTYYHDEYIPAYQSLNWTSQHGAILNQNISDHDKFLAIYAKNVGFWNYTVDKYLTYLNEIPGFSLLNEYFNIIQVNDLQKNFDAPKDQGGLGNDSVELSQEKINLLVNQQLHAPGTDRAMYDKGYLVMKNQTIGDNSGEWSFGSARDAVVKKWGDRFGFLHEFGHALLNCNDEYWKPNRNRGDLGSEPTGQFWMDAHHVISEHLVSDYITENMWYSPNEPSWKAGHAKQTVLWERFVNKPGYENVGKVNLGSGLYWDDNVYSSQANSFLKNSKNEYLGIRYQFNGWLRFILWYKFVAPNHDDYYDFRTLIDPTTGLDVAYNIVQYQEKVAGYTSKLPNFAQFYSYVDQWKKQVDREITLFMQWDQVNIHDQNGKIITELSATL